MQALATTTFFTMNMPLDCAKNAGALVSGNSDAWTIRQSIRLHPFHEPDSKASHAHEHI